MKRWALWLALFLSLGFNLGLLVSRLMPEEQIAARPPAARTTEADGRAARRADDLPAPVPPRLERMVVRLADELGLGGDERRRFFNLQHEFFSRTVRARRQVRRLESDVRRLLLANNTEREEVEGALERVVCAKGGVESAFLDHYFAARELLDDRQMRRYRRFLGQLRRVSEDLSRPSRRGQRSR